MVLVIGATGTVGRQVVTDLAGREVAVRAVSRRPAAARLPDGVNVVGADLLEPASLEAHLDGVDSVFLVWPFASHGLATGVARRLVELLARRVRRIVYLSAAAAGDQPDSFWAALERLIEASGAEWTFLRPTGFAVNTLMWADQIRTGDVVRWPYGAAARSLIHEKDIAAVAARALVDRSHVGARYVLTGPGTVTQAEQVRIIGEAIGRELRWEEMDPELARARLVSAWGDPGFVDAALSSWARLVVRPEPVTGTVEAVTGRPARTFRQWADDHADAFRPAAAHGAA